MLILTNNPLVETSLKPSGLHVVAYHPVGLRQIFVLARDLVHQGHQLLTHPLSGSVKPHETCYKSIGLSDKALGSVQVDSLLLIEDAILACDKFRTRDADFYQTHQDDLQMLDWSLLRSALGSAC